MTNTITLTNKPVAEKIGNITKKLNINGSLMLIALMFVLGTVLALSRSIPLKNVMQNYSYDVLVILIVMELFTNLIAETGIMQLIAIKIAEQLFFARNDA